MRRKLDAAQRHMGDVFATFTRYDRNKSGTLDCRTNPQPYVASTPTPTPLYPAP